MGDGWVIRLFGCIKCNTTGSSEGLDCDECNGRGQLVEISLDGEQFVAKIYTEEGTLDRIAWNEAFVRALRTIYPHDRDVIGDIKRAMDGGRNIGVKRMRHDQLHFEGVDRLHEWVSDTPSKPFIHCRGCGEPQSRQNFNQTCKGTTLLIKPRQHKWAEADDKIKWPHCIRCGMIRREDGLNKPCKGPARVGPRKEEG